MVGNVSITGHAEGKFVPALSFQHMKACVYFRDRVIAAEAEYAGLPFGAFFEEVMIFASACIMSSVASLEALANELFMLEGSSLYQQLEREMAPTLEKYQRARDILETERLDETTAPYYDAKSLILLRNALVHYKPAWDIDHTTDLRARLESRFAVSPFVDNGADFVAMKCMSAGCASWAVETVQSFIGEFYGRTKILPKKFERLLAIGK